MSAQRKVTLAIIDSHALIHRAYHALPPMSTRDGEPTNAVYGFTMMLLKLLTKLKPTHVVAAFDVKGPTFRHKAYADYKAQREAPDDDLVWQFDLVRQVVRAFNIPIVQKQGFEADDIIGTLVTKIDGGVKKVIVTGDMDTLQLIDDDTSVLTLRRGITDTVTYDEELVRERYGFGPEYIADYKGLAGDASDNFPGVPGIGDKTAKELVSKYGSIENIYQHLDEVSNRARNRLTGHKKEALFFRKLAQIKLTVPLAFTLSEAELADYDVSEVTKLFERFEFRNLLQKLPVSNRPGNQLSLLGDKRAELPPMPANYHIVETVAAAKKLREQLLREKIIAFDTETDGLGARTSPILGMSFAIAKGKKTEAWYVPVTPEGLADWRELLESSAVKKVGHNLKYDLEVIRQSGIELKGIAFDTMVASYLLNPGSRAHKLDTLAVQELGRHPIPIEQLIGQGKEQRTLAAVPLKDLGHYAAEDADITWQLYQKLAPRIKEEGLTRVFEEIELPLIPVLADIELAGVQVDLKQLAELRKKGARRIQALIKKIHQAAGETFNINSTQQLREVLYKKLNLPTDEITRTQSGYSTAAAELAKLREAHPIIKLLEEYRELTKLQSTYIEKLPELVDHKTGRIYASFNQTVAATGRLSSESPNLQNIPVRTELGREIRAAFVAPRGRRLVAADYSQLELRLAAHISQDEKMIDAFREGRDIHAATAAWVFGVPQDTVTAQQRRDAKTLNFGVLYGMGPKRFAGATGVSIEEARSFIERYRKQFSGITDLLEQVVAQAEDQGFVETLLGRRRYVPEINARAPAIRAQAERIAFNFPMQGTAADLLKKAMIELTELLHTKYPEAKLILTVHDELVCEVATAEAEALARDMKKLMEGVYTLDVPLTVDVSIGTNWRDLKPLT
ncbi:DNA polymerase I [Patescibacteria group bacterium]|nr:DNA polymerase I [Patescibacteria group bacterium]